MELTERHRKILKAIAANDNCSISTIKAMLNDTVSTPTLNRDLALLNKKKLIIKRGKGRSIVYDVSSQYKFLHPDLGDSYFDKDVDERTGHSAFNQDVFAGLKNISLFTNKEMENLKKLHKIYLKKIAAISPTLLKKEIERLSIELSWKSSQIEGNTYSLLETELLLSEKLMAKNKNKSEAIMLLNHKTAIDYLYQKRIVVTPLKIATIENIHSLLIKDLGVNRNLRKHTVGITGTTYTPPDNEFQIKEYLEKSCDLINAKKSVFEKAMLIVLLISYVQPFEDGNKRTGRITGNAILIENGYCPLSYRSVTPLDYKKAMILFYEQNNISAYKKLFMEQYEFAVMNYF